MANNRYIAIRVGQAIFTALVTITLAYFAFRALPGGPAQAMERRLIEQAQERGQPVRMRNIHRQVELYTGVDPGKPIWEAYYEYVRDIVLYQNFGYSIYKDQPVFTYLFAKMPWSVFLSVYGLALGRTSSLLLGATAAYKEGSRFDGGLTVFTIANRGVPYYFVAIFFLVIFGFVLGWFPTAGRTTQGTVPGLNYPYMAGVIHHASLPILTSFVAGFGGALAYRGNCIREMGESYIKLGHLRGISAGRIAIRYIGRNAILPVYTGLVMGIASVFGSSIIIETIFTYPAMGYATFGALTNRDYPLLMGALIFFTLITILGVLIADLTYGLIDPRVKSGGDRESY
jgi:peptide/nickel transport system permease protein